MGAVGLRDRRLPLRQGSLMGVNLQMRMPLAHYYSHPLGFRLTVVSVFVVCVKQPRAMLLEQEGQEL
jgi:hypothetical protein